ncbi:MAG TPA: S-adenosylmethionine:tRNA ribosyltransferase-isomerase, partial [Myxococcota bacterium]|nr:S-adenosylmethionine:tRNA ribosyltransferase-isomerase [Myxococcota bacterium]
PGTFLPIKTANIAEHKMHSEFFALDEPAVSLLNRAKESNRRIIAVGTTSMRVLEQVMQWAQERGENRFFECQTETSLFIRPGHRFLACDALITNFHTPRSTLLLLVSAILGRERVLKAYQEAIEQKYRFFSYGDACFFDIRN